MLAFFLSRLFICYFLLFRRGGCPGAEFRLSREAICRIDGNTSNDTLHHERGREGCPLRVGVGGGASGMYVCVWGWMRLGINLSC